MQFQDEVAAGIVLVRPALRSPDFEAGVSGWSVNVDGSAEFNNVVIRGGAGAAAIVIGPSGMPQVVIDSNASAGYIAFPTNRPIEEDIGLILSGVVNSGAANENSTLQIIGPSVSGADDSLSIFLSSQNNDGSSQANLVIRYDNGAGSTANLLTLDTTVGLTVNRSATVSPTSTVGNALTVNAAAGMTGDLLALAVNSGVMLNVDQNGFIETYGADMFGTYVPVWGNTGGAGMAVNSGWYMRIGPMWFFTAYASFNGAGAGAAAVTVTAPVSLYRGTRQVVSLNYSNVFGAGNIGNGNAVTFTGGAGAVIDALRASDQGATNADTSITGADITASSIITVTGWVRAA